MLKIGVYIVSHPVGVWKLVAPRSASAPAGVPMSSGTTNTRMTSSAPSRERIGTPMNVTSSFIIPTAPRDIARATEKTGVGWPLGDCRQ
jgi:hypothetical protein